MAASSQPIFERIGIQKQIDEAFSRQVWLPCGGYIVIDETEALIAIDVNTGRNRGSKDVDKMILADQHRGRRRGRPPAPPAQHRRPGRRRLHRHAPPQGPAGGLQGDEGPPQAGQGQDPGAADLAHRPDGNDPPAPQRIAARLDVRALPVLPGPRPRQDPHDHVRRDPAPPQHRHPETPRLRRRPHRHRQQRRAQPLQERGLQVVGRTRTLPLRPPHLPLGSHPQPRTLRHHRRRAPRKPSIRGEPLFAPTSMSAKPKSSARSVPPRSPRT